MSNSKASTSVPTEHEVLAYELYYEEDDGTSWSDTGDYEGWWFVISNRQGQTLYTSDMDKSEIKIRRLLFKKLKEIGPKARYIDITPKEDEDE